MPRFAIDIVIKTFRAAYKLVQLFILVHGLAGHPNIWISLTMSFNFYCSYFLKLFKEFSTVDDNCKIGSLSSSDCNSFPGQNAHLSVSNKFEFSNFSFNTDFHRYDNRQNITPKSKILMTVIVVSVRSYSFASPKD